MPIDDLIRHQAFISKLHRSYFISIGRALHIAQHFEKTCRDFVNILDLRQGVLSGDRTLSDGDLERFSTTMRKRMLGSSIKLLPKLADTPESIDSLLKRALIARNYIAHDITLSAIDPFSSEGEIWNTLVSLLKNVIVLSEADEVVNSLVCFLTEHELLQVPKNYVEELVDWVFHAYPVGTISHNLLRLGSRYRASSSQYADFGGHNRIGMGFSKTLSTKILSKSGKNCATHRFLNHENPDPQL